MNICSVEAAGGACLVAMIESDADLVRRYATEGSDTAFAELVRRHVALAGWLYVATRHAAANVMRAEARRARREAEACAMDVTDSSNHAWEQLRPELEAVLDALESPERDVVLLRFFEGRSFGEIGEALAISEDAARVRTHRALERLRVRLARRGITSTAAALGGLLATQAAGAVPAGMAASIATAALSGAAMPLAAGASLGAGALGVLTFMNMTKFVVGVAVAAAVLATSVSVHALRERDGALAELRVARAEFDGLSRAQAEAADARRGLEERLAAATIVRAPAERAEPVGAASARPAQPATSGNMATLEMQYGDPAYVEASLRHDKASFPFLYGPLCRRLGLSPQQVAALDQAVAARSTDMSDVMTVAVAQGLSINDPAVVEMIGAAQTRNEDTIRAILGPEGFAEFQAFRREGGVSGLNEFLVEAQLRGIPVSSEQLDELLRLRSTHKVRVKTAKGSLTGHDWEGIVSAMGEALAPEQRELLKAFGKMQSASIAKSVASAAARQRAASSGPAPP